MTIVRLQSNKATYIFSDHLGSPVAGVQWDSSQGYHIEWRERFTPFGITLNNHADNNDLDGFTGHIKDSATGLNYMQARYYDPVMGRMLSLDPETFTSKDMNQNYFNRYTYTMNNAVNSIDPDGKQFGGCQHCNDYQTTNYQKQAPTSGQVTTRGGGTAPANGTTYADGRYDPTGANSYRVDSNGNGIGHEALDLAGQTGDAVHAAMDGTVVRADSNSASYGGQVVIRMVDGNFSQTAHMDSISVAVGDNVSVGDQVGTVGNTGNASNRPAHVHWEIRTGPDHTATVQNPSQWLSQSFSITTYAGR